VTEQARNRLYLFAHCACDCGRPSAHKFRTQRAAASTRGIWHCRRSLYASCGLKLSGRCIPHFGKRRRLTIRPITTAATRRREFAYPDDKPEPNRLWRPRVKVKDCRLPGSSGANRSAGITSGLPVNGKFAFGPKPSREQGHVTTTLLSCCTNAEPGERAGYSSGLRCRHRSPSPMEHIRDEGGSLASARSGGGARSRFRWRHGRGGRV